MKPLKDFDVELERKEGDTWTLQAFTGRGPGRFLPPFPRPASTARALARPRRAAFAQRPSRQHRTPTTARARAALAPPPRCKAHAARYAVAVASPAASPTLGAALPDAEFWCSSWRSSSNPPWPAQRSPAPSTTNASAPGVRPMPDDDRRSSSAITTSPAPSTSGRRRRPAGSSARRDRLRRRRRPSQLLCKQDRRGEVVPGGSARAPPAGPRHLPTRGLIAAGVNNTTPASGEPRPHRGSRRQRRRHGNDLIDVEAEVKAIKWAVERDARA